jgi:predicted phosphodiesterase
MVKAWHVGWNAVVCAVRAFALSDLHVDYAENLAWVEALSLQEYTEDVLVLPGDLSARPKLQSRCLATLRKRFKAVFFAVGNHDVWVQKDAALDSWARIAELDHLCVEEGIDIHARVVDGHCFVPLRAWYDFSFGMPSSDLRRRWADFRNCRWPLGMDEVQVNAELLAGNSKPSALGMDQGGSVITFSHFLPRPDALPAFVDPARYWLLPVLGCHGLETQIRQWGSHCHVFGHSHLNARRMLDGVVYINNAFGYPAETKHVRKRLLPLPLAP